MNTKKKKKKKGNIEGYKSMSRNKLIKLIPPGSGPAFKIDKYIAKI